MQQTNISWTDISWNPVHGCSRVSTGCKNCYAEALSLRMGHSKRPWTASNVTHNVKLKSHKLHEPYKLKQPSRVFVNSMSDLFHPEIPDEYVAKIFNVMLDLPQHTFQILTKRPEQALRWDATWWAPHIWLGVSIEHDKTLFRQELLESSAAPVRFISFEPLIAPLHGELDFGDIDWVIVGGESGAGFRPMPHEWVWPIRDACLAYKTAFYFKQSANRFASKGTTLRHEIGNFWHWHQWPDDHAAPRRGAKHSLSYIPSYARGSR